MTAEIINFIPRAHLLRASLLETKEREAERFALAAPKLFASTVSYPTDCGNIGHPWPGEDKA